MQVTKRHLEIEREIEVGNFINLLSIDGYGNRNISTTLYFYEDRISYILEEFESRLDTYITPFAPTTFLNQNTQSNYLYQKAMDLVDKLKVIHSLARSLVLDYDDTNKSLLNSFKGKAYQGDMLGHMRNVLSLIEEWNEWVKKEAEKIN